MIGENGELRERTQEEKRIAELELKWLLLFMEASGAEVFPSLLKTTEVSS